MITCKICQKEYLPNPYYHHKTGICMDCKKIAKKLRQQKYNKSEKRKLANIRWYLNPKRKITEKRYREKDKSKKLAVKRVLKYAKKYPEKMRVKAKIYSHKRRGYMIGNIDYNAWLIKLDNLGNKCLICGSSEITIDHIIPVKLGGKNNIENLQPLCRSCNAKKGAKYASYL